MAINDFWLCENETLNEFLGKINNMARMPINLGVSQLKPYVEGNRATITISGVLMKDRASWMWDVTSYQEIINAISEAEAMAGVDEILFDFSSGGGGVLGVAEAAEAIANCKKKTIAYASFCCSAAYWLAAQCNEIIAEQNAIVGSIGVMRTVADYSKYYEDMGIKIELFRSGELKGEGAIGTSLNEAQRESIQNQINGLAENFKQAIMQGRNMSAEISRGRSHY